MTLVTERSASAAVLGDWYAVPNGVFFEYPRRMSRFCTLFSWVDEYRSNEPDPLSTSPVQSGPLYFDDP